MPDQGVETGVSGDDMKKSAGIFFRELTDVEGDVEIQSVLANWRGIFFWCSPTKTMTRNSWFFNNSRFCGCTFSKSIRT
jgi:hypothetical protein